MKKILIKQIDYNEMYENMNELDYNTFRTLIGFLPNSCNLIDVYNECSEKIGYNVVAECYCGVGNDDCILEECFRYFNIQNDDTPLTDIEYKCKIVDGLRCMHSLSVGDVVQIDDAEYLCANIGWKRIN